MQQQHYFITEWQELLVDQPLGVQRVLRRGAFISREIKLQSIGVVMCLLPQHHRIMKSFELKGPLKVIWSNSPAMNRNASSLDNLQVLIHLLQSWPLLSAHCSWALWNTYHCSYRVIRPQVVPIGSRVQHTASSVPSLLYLPLSKSRGLLCHPSW